MTKITTVAKWINDYCESGQYFWACGLVKETIELWKNKSHYSLLHETAQMMADHYSAT